jgi:hypothetical protein
MISAFSRRWYPGEAQLCFPFGSSGHFYYSEYPLKYIMFTFSIQLEQGVPVHVDPESIEADVQLERAMRGDRTWVQLRLPGTELPSSQVLQLQEQVRVKHDAHTTIKMYCI